MGSSTSSRFFNNQTHIDMCVRALRRVCAARARCGLRPARSARPRVASLACRDDPGPAPVPGARASAPRGVPTREPQALVKSSVKTQVARDESWTRVELESRHAWLFCCFSIFNLI